MDDLEQKLKERLLEDLIEHMSNGMGNRLKPKAMSVEVAAPDKDKLAEGLDKAKDVLGASPDDTAMPSDDDSDEQRLMDLMGHDDDDDDDKMKG